MSPDPDDLLTCAHNQLIRREYPDALATLLRCWDEGDGYSLNFWPVKVSFVVGYLESLCRDYEPARPAVRERLERLNAKIISGEADWRTERELEALKAIVV